eukprot:584007-Pyramimonas_sp.AAC.1
MFDAVLPKVPGPPTIEVGDPPLFCRRGGSITKSAPFHCPLPEPCTGRSCGDRPRGPAPLSQTAVSQPAGRLPYRGGCDASMR